MVPLQEMQLIEPLNSKKYVYNNLNSKIQSLTGFKSSIEPLSIPKNRRNDYPVQD